MWVSTDMVHNDYHNHDIGNIGYEIAREEACGSLGAEMKYLQSSHALLFIICETPATFDMLSVSTFVTVE